MYVLNLPLIVITWNDGMYKCTIAQMEYYSYVINIISKNLETHNYVTISWKLSLGVLKIWHNFQNILIEFVIIRFSFKDISWN